MQENCIQGEVKPRLHTLSSHPPGHTHLSSASSSFKYQVAGHLSQGGFLHQDRLICLAPPSPLLVLVAISHEGLGPGPQSWGDSPGTGGTSGPRTGLDTWEGLDSH